MSHTPKIYFTILSILSAIFLILPGTFGQQSSSKEDGSMIYTHVGYLADFASYLCMKMYGKPCH
ncbi:unnamed protein product [Larinioides sclopetarius]|uniref:Uncharacterized protein n=1 Tax=Larinioides sclopetarius TaxID=280406 RepID=A0AAV2B8Q6_9ARAC